MWRRVGAWSWRALMGFGPALVAFGMTCGAVLPLDRQWEEGPVGGTAHDPALADPCPGHPERLVAEVPLTPVEQQLWSQLAERTRKA